MSNFSGSCLCGAVQYKSTSDPLIVQNCHCTDCRKAYGSVYMTNVFIKEENFQVSGVTSEYSHLSDAKNKLTKFFCPKCGSHVYGKNTGTPNIITIRSGTVNETEIINPSRNLFLKSKVHSSPLNQKLDKFEGMPK